MNDMKQSPVSVRQFVDTILLSTPDVIVLLSIEDATAGDFRYMFANESAKRERGIDETAYGKQVLELLPETTGKTFVRHLQETASNKRPSKFFLKMPNRHIQEVTATPILDKGTCTHILCISRDVTNERTLLYHLEEQKERYASLFEHNSSAIFTLDLTGRFSSVNACFEALVNTDSEDILGEHFSKFLAPNEIQRVTEYFSKTATEGEPQRYTTDVTPQNQSLITTSVHTVPIIVQEKIVGVYGIAENITESIRTREELRQTKEEFELILNHIADAVFLFEANGNISKINPAYTEMFGYRENEIIGRSLLPFEDETDAKRTADVLHKLRLGKSIPSNELNRITKDGRNIVVLASYRPIFDVENQFIGGVGVYKDITDLKAMQERNQEAQAGFQRLIEFSPVGIVLHKDEQITYANPTALATMGAIKASDVISHNFSDFLNATDLKKVRNRMNALHSGLPPMEVQFFGLSGAKFLAEVTGTQVTLHGETYAMTTIQDITERKNAQKRLEESEAKYRLIADHSDDLIGILRLDGIVHYASPSHQRVLGLDPSEYHDRMFFDQVHPDDVAPLMGKFMTLVATKCPLKMECRYVRADGSHLWVEASGTPILDGNGNVEHVLVVSRNIEMRKQYEDELKDLAYTDGLTGLPNRRVFKNVVTKSISSAKRKDKTFAVMFLDCDKFKQINDSMGHDVGDFVLKGFAKRICSCLRDGDVVARYGGDEFVILLNDATSPEAAEIVAQRIVDTMQTRFEYGVHCFNVSTSIGIAFYDGETSDELIQRADEALYKAKKAGRNNYKFATPKQPA